MARKVIRQKRLCSKAVSTTSLFYIFCSCLCVSYPVLASINGWVQGSILPDTSLEFYERYEAFLSANHRLTHGHGVLGMLNQLQYHLDNRIVRPKLRHKCKCQPKSFPASSLVQSFVLIVCTAKSIFYLSLMLFVGIGALITMYPLLVVSCVVSLVLGVCIINQVTINNPQSVDSVEPQLLQRATFLHVPSVAYSVHTAASFSSCPNPLMWTLRGSENYWQYEIVFFKLYVYSTKSAISLLLLMSGDIETNPGPESKTLSRFETTPVPASDDVSKNESERKMKDKPDNSELLNVTQSFQTSSPSATAETKRAFYVTQESSDVPPQSPVIAGPRGLLRMPSSVALTISMPPPKLQQLKLSKSAIDLDYKGFISHIRMKLDQLLTHLKLERQWNPRIGLMGDVDGPEQLFILTNQLFMYREGCRICPLCMCEKADPSKPMSHIIPQCILFTFKEIHCSTRRGESCEFMYDFLGGKKLGPKAAKQPLLCIHCENRASKYEKKLRIAYIHAMNPENACFHFKADNNWLQYILAHIMFRGVLVNVELTKELFGNVAFKEKFIGLWKFCQMIYERNCCCIRTDNNRREKCCKAKCCKIRCCQGRCSHPKHPAPNLKVFLLPNESLNKYMFLYMFGIECVFRTPMYTTLINSPEGGVFLYTKFDCFHVVLPIDEKSTEYFERVNDSVSTKESLDKIVITIRPRSIGDQKNVKWLHEKKAINVYYPKEVRPNLFPHVLSILNFEIYKEIVLKISHRTTKLKIQNGQNCLMIPFSGKKEAEIHEYDPHIEDTVEGALCHRTSTAVDIHRATVDPEIQHDIIELDSVPRAMLKEMINNAAKISPIRAVASVEAKKEKLMSIARYLKEKLDELREDAQDGQVPQTLERQYATAKIELRIALTDTEHILHILPLKTLMEEMIEIRERQQRERLTREKEEEIRKIQDEYNKAAHNKLQVVQVEKQREVQHKTNNIRERDLEKKLVAKDEEIEKLKAKIASLEQEQYQDKVEVVKMKYKIKKRELNDRHAEEEKEMNEHLNDLKKFFDDFHQRQAEEKERREKQLMKHLKRLLQIPKQTGPRRSISLTAETDTDFENETTTEVFRSISSTCNC